MRIARLEARFLCQPSKHRVVYETLTSKLHN